MTEFEKKLVRAVIAANVMRHLQQHLRHCREKVGPERNRRYTAARQAEEDFDRLSTGLMEELDARGCFKEID